LRKIDKRPGGKEARRRRGRNDKGARNFTAKLPVNQEGDRKGRRAKREKSPRPSSRGPNND
jgi:hypothetical protein